MAELLSALRKVSHQIYDVKKIEPNSDCPENEDDIKTASATDGVKNESEIAKAFAHRRKIWRENSLNADDDTRKISSIENFPYFFKLNKNASKLPKKRHMNYRPSKFLFKISKTLYSILNIIYEF